MEQFYIKPLGLEEYPAPDVAIFEILGMRFVIAYAENGEEVFVQENAVAMTLESQKKAKPKTERMDVFLTVCWDMFMDSKEKEAFLYIPDPGKKRKGISLYSSSVSEIRAAFTAPGFVFLSTKEAKNGAIGILFPAADEKLGAIIGSFYLLPASVNHSIIIPASKGMTLNQMREHLLTSNVRLLEKGLKPVSNTVSLYDAGLRMWKELRF